MEPTTRPKPKTFVSSMIDGFMWGLILGVLLFSWPYFIYGYKAFSSNFSSAISDITKIGFVVISLIYLVVYTVLLYYKFSKEKKFNWWKINTFCIMVLLLIVGLMFIQSTLGQKKLDLVLREYGNDKKVLGNIQCTDNNNDLIVGNTVFCQMQPILTNISAYINFTLDNNSIISQNFSNLRFIPPNNVKSIYLQINGDSEGKHMQLHIGYAVKFLDKDENEKRKEKFTAYILGLFGVILFSVPSMMVNLKDL